MTAPQAAILIAGSILVLISAALAWAERRAMRWVRVTGDDE